MRDRFWELPLDQLDREEWESLCDGCGRCCLHKIEDEDTGAIEDTNVACKLLDLETTQCRDYRHRKAYVPDCLRLSRDRIEEYVWLPDTLPRFGTLSIRQPGPAVPAQNCAHQGKCAEKQSNVLILEAAYHRRADG